MKKNSFSWYDNLKKNNSKLYDILLGVKDSLDYTIFKLVPDKSFVKLQYRLLTGKHLNLEKPVSFNERLQWLKINQRMDLSMLVDKYEVKKYVSEKLGSRYVFPTLGVWEKYRDIDFSKLPEKFVLKTTHDSGGVIICQSKAEFNGQEAEKFLNKHLRRNYYWHAREFAYKNVHPRIIAEPYMQDESRGDLKDYKVFCFDGVPKVIQVDFDRFSDHKRNLYTPDWTYIPAQIKYKCAPEEQIPKPQVLEELLRCASVLSQGFTHVRADFYVIGNQVYFGELTFCHGGGCEKFTPESFGNEMGSWIKLDN